MEINISGSSGKGRDSRAYVW